MQNSPNFPRNLDIKPSEAPVVGEDTHSGINVGSDGRFDYAAQENAIRRYGIAGRVWEASYAILAYVDRPPHGETDVEFDPPPFTNSRLSRRLTVLELGSGTGLVASRIADRCALEEQHHLVVATDLPEVCPLLESNLYRHQSVRVRPLAWGNRAHTLDIASDLALPGTAPPSAGSPRYPTHIVCSDLVYFPALLAPLLRTLLHLTSPPFVPPEGAPAQAVLSYRIRSLVKETPFWSAFGLWFSFAPVFVKSGEGWSRFVPVAGDDETFVFVAERRPESRRWVVPEDDRELLNGVGARGTNEGKADDTFETILFMGMGLGKDE
ncbi:hypothetical protein BKA93DRAFT_887465 [Sparassis latifolia]